MKLALRFPTQRFALAAGFGAFCLMGLMIAVSPLKLCYDERYHISLVQSVQTQGWRAALTSPDNPSAAGPLYPAIHLITAWATKLKAPAIRAVNYLLLAIIIIVVARTVKTDSGKLDWWAGLSVLSVPFLWPSAGLALTEIPALAAFTLFVSSINRILQLPDESSVSVRFAWSGIAGLFLGLSILGRQTYLIVLPAVAVLFFVARKKWALWMLCLCVASGVCGWIFALWGGLVPPSQQFVNSGLCIKHGALSLSYVAVASLFLRPKCLKPQSFTIGLLAIVAGMLLALLSRDYAAPPAKSLLLQLFGEDAGLLIGFSIGSTFMVLGVLWGWNVVLSAWGQRREPFRVFLFLALFGLVAAPAKISHEFSSRYVVGLLTVLVFVVQGSGSSRTSYAMRVTLGSLVGALTLSTYYWR